ncbi:Replicative DNA helicase (DnaB), partial [hydrothermal vent metagenome]
MMSIIIVGVSLSCFCEEDFYRHDHRLIFRSIARLEAADKPFDVITLSDELSKTHEL